MRLDRRLANLGYGSRKEVQRMIHRGDVTTVDGEVLNEKSSVEHDEIRVDGEQLEPPSPLLIVMNKPVGYVCSTDERETTVYELLPERFAERKPGLNTIGRLDKDTTGMLLLTDDGQQLHRAIHPKSKLDKVYHAVLDKPLNGSEGGIFASGELLLDSDRKPLLPASLEVLSENEALVIIHEGRYHQVRRMFAAVGNHVNELRRVKIGNWSMPDDLEKGKWRMVTEDERVMLFGK